MSISGLNGVNGIGRVTDSSLYTSVVDDSGESKVSFDSLLQSALDMVKETNQLTNKAEEEEIKYAMGMSDSVHDLELAQEKANISLQYTIAVRNGIIDAYKEIMNMQF